MSVQKGNPEAFELWNTHAHALIGKITRDGGTASQAASALGLGPGDVQTSPAVSPSHPVHNPNQWERQPNIKPVIQPQLKDKGKPRGKGKGGSSKSKSKPKQPRERCFSWNRKPDALSGDEKKLARALGRRVAEIAKKLAV